MEEPLLPRLLPGDPENRLSVPARQRVMRAHLESERIMWEALAKAEARHLSEDRKQYVLKQADLKGVRIVLKVLAAEYDTAGLSLREYWSAIKEEIESAGNSFSLSGAQRRMLEVEFHLPPARKPAFRQNASALASPIKAEDSVGAQIKRYRDECELTTEELAEAVELEVRSVQRHLANAATPYVRHRRKYQRVFSKLLNRKVVIGKLS
jgi:DNA-binding XRE family transcriptional regulator